MGRLTERTAIVSDVKSGVDDPAAYHQRLAPFESMEAANAAVQAFFADLYELCRRHKIPDAHVVIKVLARLESGEVGDALLDMHVGSGAEAEAMVAWAMGRVQLQRQEAIAALIRGRTLKSPENRR